MRSLTEAWFPDRNDELLLDIVMGSSADPAVLFKKWRTMYDWESAPDRIYCLMPFVFYRLQTSDIQESDRNRLAGIARKTAIMNKLLLAEWEKIIRQMTDQDIQCWVAGEILVALMINHKDFLKPVHHLEIAVSSINYPAVLKILKSNGWILEASFCQNQTGLCQYINMKMPVKLTLYNIDTFKRILPTAWGRIDENNLSAIAQSSIHLEDMLTACCVKGILGRTEPQLDWIMDIYWLLRINPETIDWQAAVERFIFIGLPFHGLQAIRYLMQNRHMEIPDEAMNLLINATISHSEKRIYQYGMAANFSARLIYHWHLSSIETNGQGRLFNFFGKILCKLWNKSSASVHAKLTGRMAS